MVNIGGGKTPLMFKLKGVLNMGDTKAEIARVEKALSETKSPYLKRDYEKYLRKLRKRLKAK